MNNINCIMPEEPYCPSCKYGYIAYADEDYGSPEPPTSCEWICLLKNDKEQT